jgi:hypothetical protein
MGRRTGAIQMNEIIEINEDNCVLSDGEMKSIDDICSHVKEHITVTEKSKKYLDRLFLKITKLNDLVKQAKEEQE